MAKKRHPPKVKSFNSLYQMCSEGDTYWQNAVIGTLTNFGCDHLKSDNKEESEWQRSYYGLQRYLDALCSEYEVPEDKAEKEVLAEINAIARL